MQWEAIGAIGEVAGALVVGLTLIYLVIQIKQQARSINSSTIQANIDAFNDFNVLLATNQRLADVFERGSQAPAELTDEDSASYIWLLRVLMNLYQTLYDHYQEGACPEALWMRHVNELQSFMDMPGIRAFRAADPGFESVFKAVEAMDNTASYNAAFSIKHTA